MARGSRSPGIGRQRKHWEGTIPTPLALTAAGTFIWSSLGINSPVTILRCIGELLINLDETSVAGDEVQITAGIAIVSADAFSVGASALPDPEEDPEFDWLWWYPTFLAAPDASESSHSGASRIRVDSKAMRKVKPSQNLIGVVQYKDITGLPAVQVNGMFRVLLGE